MCQNTHLFFYARYLQLFLASKNTRLVINRARGFTAIALCSCSHAIAELAAGSVNQAREISPASYSIATLGGLFFLFSGVTDARHCPNKLLYLVSQALYSPVPNKLNTQGSVLHSSKVNKPNSKLSMTLPPFLPLSAHLCQLDPVPHFAS